MVPCQFTVSSGLCMASYLKLERNQRHKQQLAHCLEPDSFVNPEIRVEGERISPVVQDGKFDKLGTNFRFRADKGKKY